MKKNNIITFIFILIVILSSYLVFPQDQIKVFTAFLLIIPVYLVLKSEISPIIYSIALLIFSAVELAHANYVMANKLSIYSYWLLVVGVIIYLVNFLKNRYTVTKTDSKVQYTQSNILTPLVLHRSSATIGTVSGVSIIIPTKNSARTIGKCLDSIRAQTFKNIEILIVDGGSSDNTTEIGSQFGAKIFFLEGERTKAKNFGISKSNGEFLLFIDSDMILQPRVVDECFEICSLNNLIAGVIIPERTIGTGFWSKVRDFERSFYAGSIVESPRFFKHPIVTQVGGFDEDIVTYEESTLPLKIAETGMIVDARIKAYILHDEEGFNLSRWLHKKRYYSITAKSYSTKYGKHAKKQLSILYRASLFLRNGNWKRLIRNPILTVGVLTLKTLEFIYSRRA